MTAVIFSIGANLGDRLAHLQSAVNAVAGVATGLRVSPVYETAPVGGVPQPDYLNAVLHAEVPAGIDLRALIRRAEAAAGRMRAERWGPRTLDIDVVSAGSTISDDPQLTLPHPRAAERAFVLVPWLDVDSGAELPGAGPVTALLVGLDISGVRRRDDLRLRIP